MMFGRLFFWLIIVMSWRRALGTCTLFQIPWDMFLPSISTIDV